VLDQGPPPEFADNLIRTETLYISAARYPGVTGLQQSTGILAH
jgi:hypothetical protein